MKIEYEVSGDARRTCKTDCPHGMKYEDHRRVNKVGSLKCGLCKFHVCTYDDYVTCNKEKAMGKENKDFRVGDAVCTHEYRDGEVVGAGLNFVEVKFFESGRTTAYSLPTRVLMHGSFFDVFGEVKDAKPVRTVERFVNIWLDGTRPVCSTMFCASKDAAKFAAEKCPMVLAAVAAPVQIPEDMV